MEKPRPNGALVDLRKWAVEKALHRYDGMRADIEVILNMAERIEEYVLRDEAHG